MIRIIIFCFVFLFYILPNLEAQILDLTPFISFPVSSVSINDVSDNPAKLMNIERNSIATSYSPSVFGLNELSNHSLIASFKHDSLVHFMNINGIFQQLYSYTSFGYGITYRIFDNFTPSLLLNYNSLRIRDYNSLSNFTFDIGGILELNKGFNFGFSVTNIFNSSLEERNDIKKQTARFGLEYELYDDFKVQLGTEVRIENSSGVLISFIKEIDSLGIAAISYASEPQMIQLDINLNTIDDFFLLYLLNYHNYLGVSHNFGVGYSFD
ncbi:MAG: hypothetical protein R2863_03190 [Candidatus Kapaibacterium sp.]|nr:hypothetical protein [Ignavibacteriota bacterium]MCB9220957.1 hypothetical protein [Ignavibacteria bacterium]